MAALVVKICLRKKGKTNEPSKLAKVLLGYYIRLGPGSQESRIYLGIKWLRRCKQINRNFGIKSFLYQNWGACVYTKIWKEEHGNSKASKIMPIKESIT